MLEIREKKEDVIRQRRKQSLERKVAVTRIEASNRIIAPTGNRFWRIIHSDPSDQIILEPL